MRISHAPESGRAYDHRDPRRCYQRQPPPTSICLAAERLGVTPQACVAVEDSTTAVTAAHAAGAITIMVLDMVQPTEQSRARCISLS